MCPLPETGTVYIFMSLACNRNSVYFHVPCLKQEQCIFSCPLPETGTVYVFMFPLPETGTMYIALHEFFACQNIFSCALCLPQYISMRPLPGTDNNPNHLLCVCSGLEQPPSGQRAAGEHCGGVPLPGLCGPAAGVGAAHRAGPGAG